MDAENRAAVRRIVPNTGTIEGSKDDPENRTAPAGNRGLTTAITALGGDRMAEIQRTPVGPTSVYRYYDNSGLLLYVGITGRGVRRNIEHDKSKDWWPFVARQEVDHHPTRTTAANIERELIKQFRPPFNVQHNPGWRDTRDAYLAYRGAHRQIDPGVLAARVDRGSQHLVGMVAQDAFGQSLTLASGIEEAWKVQLVDLSDAPLNISSGGRKAKLVGKRIEDGRLVLLMRTRDAERCIGAMALLRGCTPRTIKRIDLSFGGVL